MKLKNILLTSLSFVLVAALAVGGTIAYLTDTDSDVNVMTLGNVSIEQHEYQRAEGISHINSGAKEGDLVPFVQGQPLYPAVPTADDAYEAEQAEGNCFHWGDYSPGWNGLWNDSKLANVMDKFVFVENTGKSDAYYRTLIALECPEGMTIGYAANGAEIETNVNGNSRFDWDYNVGNITIDGTRYEVWSVTYNEILEPGEVSRPSLLQVILTHHATNEDMELLGGTYDILVLSQAVQSAGFESAQTALDTAFGDVTDETAAEWFKGVVAEDEADVWDGTPDTSWYDESKTEFTLTSAEQFAGLAALVDGGNNFAGKTIKLDKDIDLASLLFEPIGSYRNDRAFKGTFDGQGHTIKNLSQNTWELDNGYYYGDLGLGLFGLVEDATIKNLVMDGASISGENGLCGTVAAAAYGECAFDNITVKNSQVNDYQYYAGGVVGWASGTHTYKNINIEESTVIGSQWGDFGNCNGGIIGGAGTSGTYHFEDCTVACRIDATNDIVSAYQWYNYRNSGMLIGRVGPATIVNEVTNVTADNVTCKNVTVIYGDWAKYTYCEFAGTGYPYVRVQAGVSVDAYSNVRYGHPTDANGNTVVDDNHVHNAGEAHHELIAFDQLFGGPADHRYCYYGVSEHTGVDVVYNNK